MDEGRLRNKSRIRASSLSVLALLVSAAVFASGKADVWLRLLSIVDSESSQLSPAPPQIGSFPTGAVPGAFTTQQFSASNGQQMTYYLYVPANYSPGAQYPLVLLLHGGGESALAQNTPAQNRALLLGQQYVRDWIAPDVQTRWPSFVVVPQNPNPERWVYVPASQGSYSLKPQPSASLQQAIDIVVTLEQAYPSINSNRLYITGLSMGGYGVWEAIERWPSLFAAAVPLAGAGDPSHANVLLDLPIWAFHGGADAEVPVNGSRQMIAAIRAEGGSACYTEFQGMSHGIWNNERVYANPTLLAWLFSQSKSSSPGRQPLPCPRM